MIRRAYKTELDLNYRQRTLCAKHAGTARFAYNWGLRIKKEALDNGEKVPKAMDLHRRLTTLKKTEFSWMYECGKTAPQEALRHLDKAFEDFFARCKGKRTGSRLGKAGFPRFKSRKNGLGTFKLLGSIRVFDGGIRLPRLGTLRLKERGYLPTQGAKLLSATVSEKDGRWFVSLVVEEPRPKDSEPDPHVDEVVGVDLGVKTLATTSDGTKYENPKALTRKLRKLARLDRAVWRKKAGSSNRGKALRRRAKLHTKVANVRKDALHKVTTELATTKRAVVIEDLNVAGLVRNRRLARSIADAGFHRFGQYLAYKGEWYGCAVLRAPRFFPSSKTCSGCGLVRDDLALSERTWVCECGAVHERDLNAALNLKRRGEEMLAGSSPDSLNACGEEGSGRSFGSGETVLVEAGTGPRTRTIASE